MIGNAQLRGVLVAAFALALFGAAEAKTLTYKFKTNADAKNWSSVTQDWSVKKKAYQPTITEIDFPVAVLDKKTFADAQVSFFLDGYQEDGAAGGGFIRGTIDGNTLSGYLAVGDFQPGTGSITFSLYLLDELALDGESPKPELLCEETVSPKEFDGAFTVKAKGSTIKILYQDKLVCSASDTTYKKGRVGLFNVDIASVPSYRRVEIVFPK